MKDSLKTSPLWITNSWKKSIETDDFLVGVGHFVTIESAVYVTALQLNLLYKFYLECDFLYGKLNVLK